MFMVPNENSTCLMAPKLGALDPELSWVHIDWLWKQHTAPMAKTKARIAKIMANIALKVFWVVMCSE